MSGRCDKLSLLFFPAFLHILSVQTAPFLLALEVVYQPYVLHQGTLVPDTERGRRELLGDRVCNPTAPPLQFPRAAPQPPSQPPELSACQAHQVPPLDHLGHDFLNLLVLSKKHPGTNAPYKSLCLVPEHTEPLSHPSTPLHLFLASFTQSLRLPSSLLISQLDKFGLGIRGEKASLVERALRSVITPC